MDEHQITGGPVGYSLRLCENREDLAACVRIQKEIWGYAENDLYPLRLFVNLSHIGGHVLGVFTTEGELVGYVASMPAFHGKRRYLHSLSLGIVPAHENRGLGKALKLAQRNLALSTGINSIEWSFDPLRAKNANLNLNRLGAVVCRYEPDYYGQVESRFQQGLPSDRLIAEWQLKSPRVKRAIAGKPVRDPRRKPSREVEIPIDIDDLIRSSIDEARSCQERVRGLFQQYFEHKLVVTGFAHDEKSAHYLLEPYEN
ncbi:MAG: GNAT family N-acetyltransferase [Terriglobia bacterium]